MFIYLAILLGCLLLTAALLLGWVIYRTEKKKDATLGMIVIIAVFGVIPFIVLTFLMLLKAQ